MQSQLIKRILTLAAAGTFLVSVAGTAAEPPTDQPAQPGAEKAETSKPAPAKKSTHTKKTKTKKHHKKKAKKPAAAPETAPAAAPSSTQ
jgi:hypothetical protein